MTFEDHWRPRQNSKRRRVVTMRNITMSENLGRALWRSLNQWRWAVICYARRDRLHVGDGHSVLLTIPILWGTCSGRLSAF
jgi:hypothetical protein